MRFINYPVKADVTLTYDSLNRLLTASEATFGMVSFDYKPYGPLDYEDNNQWPNSRVSYAYDSNRLRNGLTLAQPGGNWTQGYHYDNAWRLDTVSGSSGTFSYGYESPSPWVHTISLPNSGSIRRNPDSVGRLQETLLRNAGGTTLNRHYYELTFWR